MAFIKAVLSLSPPANPADDCMCMRQVIMDRSAADIANRVSLGPAEMRYSTSWKKLGGGE
jgi:hypothetical protein